MGWIRRHKDSTTVFGIMQSLGETISAVLDVTKPKEIQASLCVRHVPLSCAFTQLKKATIVRLIILDFHPGKCRKITELEWPRVGYLSAPANEHE